ncbi:MAG: UvrD-helicase domain-containing protein [Candidatus Methanomethylophilus sp.]|nr:UvrD-helicase domain-containing protein [Methanomethylophilus sp.]MDD4668440.1 UvrD-helicase domain-containing protein [Methanomethylophilus sp.]
MGFMDRLNAEQAQAVRTTEGYVRVIAGPGTGKTRALTSRYCYLVDELGIAPRNILCATFTNRAANEMKKRIRQELGDLDLGMICTFHAFCVQLLREDINVLNYPKEYVILDNEDVKALLLKVFDDMHLTSRDLTVQQAVDGILETRKLNAVNYIDDIYLLNNEELKAKYEQTENRDTAIFLRYLYEQKKCFGLDFNDLINFAVYILDRFPAVREKWAARMEYVMVDEFQDVSARQYRLAQLLAGRHRNLFIVGDPDQTIYSWRGSHIKMFVDFDKDYPTARTVVLNQNYRSVPEILAAADALIARNRMRYPKTLRAVRETGVRPLYFHAEGKQAEAEWIQAQIAQLTAEGARYSDCAVLYRANHESRSFEECFVRKGTPYTIYSGMAFYGRTEIKDLVCYLRMVATGDDLAFRRTIGVPPRRIGRKKLAFLDGRAAANGLTLYEALKANLGTELFRGTGASEYVRCIEKARQDLQQINLGDLLQQIMDTSGYERHLRLQGDQERLDNVAELKRAVMEYGEDPDATLNDFLAQVALFTDADRDQKADRVKLMTVHTSKGMEFRYVFICGLDEGIFPSRKTDSVDAMEEERRLMYVAMTRAADALYLTDAGGLSNGGAFRMPSRFLFEIGQEHLDCAVELDSALVEEAKIRAVAEEARLRRRNNLLQPGDPVVHPVFGSGVIVRVSEKEGCYVVKFAGLDTERSIRFDAKLTRP